jgi:ribonuclease-3
MTTILSEVVSNKSLDGMVRACDAIPLLIPAVIGNQQCYGERITAGAFEAFIGALYCETGFDEVAYFVNTLFAPMLADRQVRANVIGALQEYFQKRQEPLPVYRETARSGPEHRPQFTVTVTLSDGREFAGEGTSLAGAKKAAAQAALDAVEPGA